MKPIWMLLCGIALLGCSDPARQAEQERLRSIAARVVALTEHGITQEETRRLRNELAAIRTGARHLKNVDPMMEELEYHLGEAVYFSGPRYQVMSGEDWKHIHQRGLGADRRTWAVAESEEWLEANYHQVAGFIRMSKGNAEERRWFNQGHVRRVILGDAQEAARTLLARLDE